MFLSPYVPVYFIHCTCILDYNTCVCITGIFYYSHKTVINCSLTVEDKN